MPLSLDEQRVLGGLAERGPEQIALAIDWAAVSSGNRNLVGLGRMRDALVDVLSRQPGRLELLSLAPSVEVAADGREREQAQTESVQLAVRSGAPVQVALTGHYDTVYPEGTTFLTVQRRDDGALNGPAGCPNIDTLGVRGGDIHSEAEHAWPENFAERAQLSALLLMRMATGEIDARAMRARMGEGG